MKMDTGLRASMEENQKTDGYWIEKAKLDFSMSLEHQLRIAKMNYAALGKKIGTSAAYITKIFRGDSNVTIESMVKLARATGGELDIQIVDKTPATVQWDWTKYGGNVVSITKGSEVRASKPDGDEAGWLEARKEAA